MNNSTQDNSRLWFWALVAISAVCLGVTLFRDDLRAGVPSVLRTLDVSRENTLGTWWSGMLWLLAAAHAFDGYFFRRAAQPRLARAWACFGFILLGLSADEVSSLHERVGHLSWQPLLPFALALSAMWFYALITFWLSREDRRMAPWTALVFLLLLCVAGQEYLEHHVNWWGTHARMRTAVEEGTEIFGVLILLRLVMAQSGGLFQRDAGPQRPVFQALAAWRVPIVGLALLAAPVLAAWTIALAERSRLLNELPRGIPVAWLASACFFLAGLALVRHSLAARTKPPVLIMSLAGLSVALSAVVVGMGPQIFPRRGIVLCTVGLLCIWMLWLWAARGKDREGLTLLAALGAGTIGLAWFQHPSLVVTFFALAVAAASVLYAHSLPAIAEPPFKSRAF